MQQENKQEIKNMPNSINLANNLVMNEYTTEFFANFVGRTHKIDSNLLKPYRRLIIDFFNVDTFFQMSIVNFK